MSQLLTSSSPKLTWWAVCAAWLPTHVALQVPIDQAAQNVQFSERIFGNTNVTVALYSGTVSTEQSGALAEATTDSDLVPHGAVACYYPLSTTRRW